MKKWIVITVLLVYSCASDQDYQVPQINQSLVVDKSVNSEIFATKKAWNQYYLSTNQEIYTFPEEGDPLIIKGYIVSSDYSGNFYKKLIIQDLPENPTHGLEILIDKTALFETFEVGRKVFITLNGLSMSYDDGADNSPVDNIPGKYILGINKNGEIAPILSFVINNYITRSNEVVTIIPQLISVVDFHEDYINTCVSLENMQFLSDELDKTFSGENTDEYDGFRLMKHCENELIVPLQSSTFADFKSQMIPEGAGEINGILTKDFKGDFYVFIVNSPLEIDFTANTRCDLDYLNCPRVENEGETILLEEDFEEKTIEELTVSGWQFINANEHQGNFELNDKDENTFIEISAYRSGETPMDVWMISPTINISTSKNEILTFETVAGYYNGKVLSVYASSDFKGDLHSATWHLLSPTLAEGPSSGYGINPTKSTNVSLSCLEGKLTLGFRYLGFDPTLTSTMRIDNIRVMASK